MAKQVSFLHPEIEKLDRDDMEKLQARKLAALGARLGESADWAAHFQRAGMHPRDQSVQITYWLQALPSAVSSASRSS